MEWESDERELKAAGADPLPGGLSGLRIHGWEIESRNALVGWKHEALPPVEVAAAAKMEIQKVVLDYDYTARHLTTEVKLSKGMRRSESNIIGVILIKIILYEDELADNGISLLTVKVRVMPSGYCCVSGVDGALMRLRDTRLHCLFGEHMKSVTLRESCWREATFQALSSKGNPSNCAAYSDPSIIIESFPIIMQKAQKLSIEIPCKH